MDFHKPIPLWMVASMFSALASLRARNASASCRLCDTRSLLTCLSSFVTQRIRRLPARPLSPSRTGSSKLQFVFINSLGVEALLLFFSHRLTRGTPTKMTLFNAASRIMAALFTASVKLLRVSGRLGSVLVMNRYRCPTDAGLLVVRSVHVCHFGLDGVLFNWQKPCTRREYKPTILCLPFPGLVERAREHAMQPFRGRTRPCFWVAQRQELPDHGGEVFDHFRARRWERWRVRPLFM